MATDNASFEAARAYVQSGEGPELSQDALLKFYALYKQATDGPCTGDAPSRLNVVAYEKWKAHKALGQMSKEEAMETYCAELSKVAPGWSSEQNMPGPQGNPLSGTSIDEQFEAALTYVQSGEGPELSQEALLTFYALYKQAADGPCTVEAPSRLHTVAYEKWKAHKALGPISSEEAMRRYVAELTKVAPAWTTTVGDRRDRQSVPTERESMDLEEYGVPADYLIVAGVAVAGVTAWWLWRRFKRARVAKSEAIKLMSKL